MRIEDFIIKTNENEKDGLIHRPRIICNDGFTMSVQASKYTYCEPRGFYNFYTEMEIGFPSEREELIMAYAENKNNPTETVYGYVPRDIIQKVIDKHKGINIELTFA